MAIKTYLNSNEITQMIDSADNLRDKVILSFYADTGCRASELLRLKVEHLDLENRVVVIPHLKRGIKKKCPSCGRSAGRNTQYCSRCGADLTRVTAEGIEERRRLINIGPETAELLREYVKDLEPSEYIIKLSRQQVYNVVRDAAQSIGIKGKAILNPESGKHHYVHTHTFRDSLAVPWLSFAGTDVGKQKALQEHLGHQSFGTTMRYNKLTPAKVKQVSDEVRQLRFARDTD
jgi:integrase/recombinase XerD